MKIKVDENLPNTVAGILRDAGHDASTVYDEGLQGASDPKIQAAVMDEGRVLITLDVGFGDIRRYPPEDQAGIVVLRLERQDIQHVEAIVARIAGSLVEERLSGNCGSSMRVGFAFGVESPERVGDIGNRIF